MTTSLMERQADKTVLPEERLHELMKYHYGVSLQKVTQATAGWQLKTDSRTYTLSRVEKMDEAYWGMVARMLEHLRQRGLTHLPSLLRTKYGKLAFNGYHSRYLLWDQREARRCDWHHPETWRSIGKTLAAIHQASRDFSLESSDKKFQAAGNWRSLWERNLERLGTVRAACELSEIGRPVDRLWLSVYTYTVTMIETAIRYLEKSGGDQEVLSQLSQGTVGQHHLKLDSWGVKTGGGYSLLDWEQTVIDVPVRDLAQMIHLASGNKPTFSQRVHLLFDGYCSVRPLKKAEWPLLYARLLFPEQMVKTVRELYEKEDGDEDNAVVLLKRKIEEQRKREYHVKFIPQLFKQISSVTIPQVDWLKA